MITYTPEQEKLLDIYLPDYGDGDTEASQAVTALCKLVYKWYNDGDVYDNRYALEGWANDISGCANWLYNHIPETQEPLNKISTIHSEVAYEMILEELVDIVLSPELLSELDQYPKDGSAYNDKGPFRFEDREEEDEWDDEYEEDEEDDDDYPWG